MSAGRRAHAADVGETWLVFEVEISDAASSIDSSVMIMSPIDEQGQQEQLQSGGEQGKS